MISSASWRRRLRIFDFDPRSRRPRRAFSFFETIPSRPSLQIASNISLPSPSVLRLAGRDCNDRHSQPLIAMIVVAVLYFAWDEISAARADRKERERWGTTWIDYH